MPRRIITEAQEERIIDRRVMRALDRDRRYLNAENAEEQKTAEEMIEAEIVADMAREYEIERG